MSGLDPAISSVLAAKQSALQTQISFAIAGKQQEAVRQQGDALVQLLQSIATQGKSPDRGKLCDCSG
ncbi:MAG: hypothetical protein K1X74_07915 [Pirellulales bacterium]|nr:hypothetical protein [Pirellulales bacterium]